MTPTEIRIAMAELEGCPWREVAGDTYEMIVDGGKIARTTRESLASILPDYPNDLNAVHRVEEKIERHLLPRYMQELCMILVPSGHRKTGVISEYMLHATARQRCEAILRAVGKWKESAA
jgi:hypothetical protein